MLRRGLIVLGLLAAVLAPNLEAARAASMYTIDAGVYPNWRGTGMSYGGYDARGSVTETAFATSGCNPGQLGVDVQGKDAYVLDARPYAGTTIATTWTAEAAADGRSYVSFYDQYCNYFTRFRTEPWSDATSATISVPAPTRWMVFTAELKRGITFTIE